MKKYIAEFLGTLVLVLFGTGIAVVSGGDLVATSLAFGLAIVAEAYVIGNISGCHVNPAVSLAMLINKKLSVKDFVWYVIAQILGAIAGTAILFFILSNTNLGTTALGANFYGELSANNISLAGAIVTEIVLTCVFIYTILGVTSDDNKSSVAGLVIGLTLTFVHLIGIPLTGTSVNPARSLAPAIFLGGEAIKQIWVFILAPLVGGALAAYLFKYLNTTNKKKSK
ncbi:MAG: MIP family channel protein [Bacilli bacterium]|nr:MIP family channel protein [Bacilli bacterium]